ncbi:AAA domain-containing protein [Clostridium tunisiense]|uniref:AAA domain-containing protein n=1 Tax=Clostridium tunisiense TaxID=219748 RepID=UPI0003006E2A|nr:AAA domain-containing protein [Clostridium tunisiense]
MDVNEKVIQIFNYLHSVKNGNDKKPLNIDAYEEVFYENKIRNLEGVNIVNSEDSDSWIEISKDAKEIYGKFSKLLLNLQKNSESMEIIYGHGLLVGKFGNDLVVHPVFTTKMDLVFNEKKSKFILKPYNNVTNIELDMLSNLEYKDINSKNGTTQLSNYNFSLENLVRTSDKVRIMGINPRQEEEIKKGIEEITSALNLNTESEYFSVQSLLDLEGEGGVNIYNEPVIVFRRMDTRLWNVELTSMIDELEKGFTIPKTIEALITEEEVKVSQEEKDRWKDIGEDLLFPLPYNEEQKEIVKRLSENFGVVVQGPPGTGKSHTIVNLISHLLAHGKRVLVTSQTDRALKVLSDKIPEEIRSLCMSILGDDSRAMDSLDEAVRKITENLSLDSGTLKKQYKELKYKLAQCEENQQKLLNDLKEVYTLENSKVNYLGNSYYVAEMSKFLKANRESHSFIEDTIGLEQETFLTNQEFKRFLELKSIHSREHLNLYESIGDFTNKLPDMDKLTSNMKAYKNMIDKIYIHRVNVNGWNSSENTTYTNTNLLNIIEEAIKFFTQYEGTVMETLFNSIYQNEERKMYWQSFIASIKQESEKIYSIKANINKYRITLPEGIDLMKLKRDFQVIHNTLGTKGKIGSIFKFMHKDLNYILKDILIDGESINSLEQSNIIKNYLEIINLEKTMKNYYNSSVKEFGGRIITVVDSNYLSIIEEFTNDIENILSFEENYKNKVLKLLKMKKINKELNFFIKETYEYLKSVIVSLNTIKEFEEYEEELQRVKGALIKYPVFAEFCGKIKELNIDYVKQYYNNVNYILSHSSELSELLTLRNKLIEICPKFADTAMSLSHRELMKYDYEDFEGAIKYAVFNSYIQNILGIDVMAMEKLLHEEKIREKQLVRETISKKAWYNQIQRTTESQKRSLFTWMEAIKRIGKGTGAQAIKYRKLAQKEMENCKDVIPVWIMPINRVLENLKPKENLFDVVIVDESSQSDISALTVLMRAERAVIVGDEKQISPEAIGKNGDSVEELINLHLKGIPHSQWFDLKTSLYNTALRVFPNRLVLKEHFRSLEDIIGFSNNLCYSKEIVPLRCSLSKSSLTPINTVKVEEGFRDSNKPINIKEAYEIVETIKQCCENPLYDGMTMGVISLLGENQAEVIQNMLIDKIGMEEIVRRNIVCGDAYSFQGDERDVMFLSMVVGNNIRFAALSKDSDERRFNVAASRAKNQMWLFHSVELEDLNPKCVRRELLHYMKNYKENKCLEDNGTRDLILSSFEEDVYEELNKEGLQVVKQLKINKYTIDFVIGEEQKLAIKCIGKNNYRPYSYEEELVSEQTLERAGWKFLKIRSSEFYWNREKIIKTIRDLKLV